MAFDLNKHWLIMSHFQLTFNTSYCFHVLTGTLKVQVEQDFLAISQWKEVEVLEQNVQVDHVHMVCLIPFNPT